MADTKATISALRAVSTLVFGRILKPLGVLVAVLLGAAYALTIFLALSFSAWWWLLLVIFIPITVVLVIIALIGRFLLKRLLPRKLSPTEHTKIDAFAEKILDIAERSQTPRIFIMFLIAKDVLRGRESSFIRDTIHDSKSISSDFKAIKDLF